MFTIIQIEEQNTEKNRRAGSRFREHLLVLMAAALLGVSSFSALISSFGFSYTPAGMFHGPLSASILQTWNIAAVKFGETAFILLPRFQTTGSASSVFPGVFLTLLLLLITMVSLLIIKSRLRFLLLFYLLVFLALALVGVAPAPDITAFFIFSLMTALVTMSAPTVSDIRSWLIPALAVILAFAPLAAGLNENDSTVIKKIRSHFDDAHAEIDKFIEIVRFNRPSLSAGDLRSLNGDSTNRTRGRITASDLKNGKHKTQKLALVLRADHPESLYLRGFVGEVYQNSSWKMLGNETCYAARDQFYWITRANFSSLTQPAVVSEILNASPDTRQTIRINVKNASRKTLYTPYELSDREIPGAENRAQACLQSKKLTGSRRYSYESSPALTAEWTDQASRLFTADLNDKIHDYYKSESIYSEFAYRNYTQLPQSLKNQLLRTLRKNPDKMPEYPDYRQSINDVEKCLSSKYICTDSFNASGSADFIGHFMQTKKGCDIHFATLASLLFRAQGIPARYVEGYIVTPADARSAEKKSKNGKKETFVINVTQDRAHAWTEIYISGYGWVPVEVTPVYKDVMKEADLRRGIESAREATVKKNAEAPPKPEVDDNILRKSTAPGRIIAATGMMIALFLIIAAALYLLKKLIPAMITRLRLHRNFHNDDCSAAVCAIYQYMTDKDLPVIQEAEAVGLRAAYSTQPADEQDRRMMLRELRAGKKEKRRQIQENIKSRIIGHGKKHTEK